MERAELEEDAGTFASGGAGGSGGGPVTIYPTCEARSDACTTCLSGCRNNALGRCLESLECRLTLYDHRLCLDDQCANPSSECIGRVFADGIAAEVGRCLSDTCLDQCEVASAVSICDLYCSCMDRNCPGRFSPCREKCEADLKPDLDMIYCRWKHCEAQPDGNHHCDHATGITNCRPISPNKCSDRTHSGFPCRVDRECCSGTCNGNVCD
jgi:hypothetical protein